MESLDLLAREEEFRKLNNQLNKKTERLMKDIEQAMQKPDIFTDFSHSLILRTNQNTKKHTCYTSSNSSSSSNTPVHSKTYKQKTQDIKKCRKIHFEEQNDRKAHKNEHIDKEAIKHYSNDNKTQDIKDQDVAIGTNKISDEITHDGSGNNIDSTERNIDNNDVNNSYIANKQEFTCDCLQNVNRDYGLEFLHAFVTLSIKDNVLPKSFSRGNISVESVCKYLSTKIKLTQEEIERLQSVINKKKTQCENHLTQIAEFESVRMTLLNKTNNMTSGIMEMKAKCLALQKRLDEKDRLYKEQRSETDKLSSEVKRLKSKNASLEAKSASQEETIDTLKQQLDVARRAEKEFKDSSRVLSASHETAISRLESQIKTLTKRTEKQMALINNLKKQNSILTTEGALKALEKEYRGFLQQDF